MKILTEEQLPLRLKIPLKYAEKYGEKISELLKENIIEAFNNNADLQDFSYSDAMTFILKIHNIIFVRGIQLAHFIGGHFPDSENNAEELFEEAIEGLRKIIRFAKPNAKEYISGIKKIKAD